MRRRPRTATAAGWLCDVKDAARTSPRTARMVTRPRQCQDHEGGFAALTMATITVDHEAASPHSRRPRWRFTTKPMWLIHDVHKGMHEIAPGACDEWPA